MNITWICRKTLLLLFLVGLCGCVGWGPPQGPFLIDWELQIEEHWQDPAAAEILTYPHLYEGRERWFVTSEVLLIERDGEPRGQAPEKSRTWIFLPQQRVYLFDLVGEESQTLPLSLWRELQLRQSRQQMVELYRASNFAEIFEASILDYLGDFEFSVTRSDLLVSATPGQRWGLYGKARGAIDWARPILREAFDAMTPQGWQVFSEVLQNREPSEISIREWPRFNGENGATYLLSRRILIQSRAMSAGAMLALFPKERRQELDSAERKLSELSRLWQQLEKPEERPSSLSLRGLRARLQPQLNSLDVGRLIPLMDGAQDSELLEELGHLLWTADSEAFFRRYERQLAAGELAEVLAMVSVLSLEAPRELNSRMDALFDRSDLWQGLPDQALVEARSWLHGVRLWILKTLK